MDDLTPERGKSWLRTVLVSIFAFFATLFIGLAVILYFFQDKLIYYPRRYLGDAPGQSWVQLRTQTKGGQQIAFYARAGNRSTKDVFEPKQLWVVLSGNAAMAGEWESFVARYPDPDTIFLLVDYPGYGFSQGRPTPATILEAAHGAYDRLAENIGAERLAQIPVGLLGHSLGAAAGLEFFATLSRAPNKLILISPFTTMSAMARRAVGWPLSLLLQHRFDNVARLGEVLQKSPKPAVTIFHGSADEVIPVEQGRELAAAYPGVVFHEIPGELHNSIVDGARDAILRAMLQ